MYAVGDRVLVSAQFATPTGPVNLGAFPIRWNCPTGNAVTDPKYPGGVSTDGTMTFICTAGGTANLQFQDVMGGPLHKGGTTIDISPMPNITIQSAVVEGKVLP